MTPWTSSSSAPGLASACPGAVACFGALSISLSLKAAFLASDTLQGHTVTGCCMWQVVSCCGKALLSFAAAWTKTSQPARSSAKIGPVPLTSCALHAAHAATGHVPLMSRALHAAALRLAMCP